MKKFTLIMLLLLVLGMVGCGTTGESAPILATTRPVFDFTSALCEGTGLEVNLLISDSISCLHDYSLSTTQMRSVEKAETIVLSGAGTEEFAEDLLSGRDNLVDSSEGIALLECNEEHQHDHEADGHIWLSPVNAKAMAENICVGLSERYPDKESLFAANLEKLTEKLDALQKYGEETLSSLSCRELITFHDGFSYMADSFGLTILSSVEEEDGSLITSSTRIELTNLILEHKLPAIFTETNGITDSANAIAKDTGVSVFVLDMCMGETDYFTGMYHNIDTLKEALG